MYDPSAPSTPTFSGSASSARYAYLVGRLRGRQITMEEATELFAIQQTMIEPGQRDEPSASPAASSGCRRERASRRAIQPVDRGLALFGREPRHDPARHGRRRRPPRRRRQARPGRTEAHRVGASVTGRPFRFAHLADAHVGAWSRDVAVRDALRESVLRALRTVGERDCDFLLISGDLFHTPVPDPAEVAPVAAALKELVDAGRRIYTIYGSHDYVAHRTSWLDVLAETGLFSGRPPRRCGPRGTGGPCRT